MNYPPQINFEPSPVEISLMIEARLLWLRGLGDAGRPWPGDTAISGFASGFLIALRAAYEVRRG